MLHALRCVIKPREPVRRQSERLCHEPHKLIAQTLDSREVPDERGPEPRKFLFFRPLIQPNQTPYSKLPFNNSVCVRVPVTGPRDAGNLARRGSSGSSNRREASQSRIARAGLQFPWCARRPDGNSRGSAASWTCGAYLYLLVAARRGAVGMLSPRRRARRVSVGARGRGSRR